MRAHLYPLWLHLHLTCVALSLALFALRGWGVMREQAWPMRPAVRHLSVVIDTVLLTAGLTLWVTMGHDPRQEAWLALKLVLLPVYVVLGSWALKRGRTARVRRICWVLALAVVSVMLWAARTRQVPWA